MKSVDLIEKLNKLIVMELENSMFMNLFKSRWELLKIMVKGSIIQYASRKKKSKKNKIEALEKKLLRLEDEQINQAATLFADTEDQIRLVKHEILEINKEMTRGAIIRSRAKW